MRRNWAAVDTVIPAVGGGPAWLQLIFVCRVLLLPGSQVCLACLLCTGANAVGVDSSRMASCCFICSVELVQVDVVVRANAGA